MTGFLAHCIWLSLVLCHSGVDSPVIVSIAASYPSILIFHILHDIRTDWRFEDIGKGVGVLAWLPIAADDGDGRSARHVGGDCSCC